MHPSKRIRAYARPLLINLFSNNNIIIIIIIKNNNNCKRSELSSVFNGQDFRYIFQVDCRSINVLNVSTCTCT